MVGFILLSELLDVLLDLLVDGVVVVVLDIIELGDVERS